MANTDTQDAHQAPAPGDEIQPGVTVLLSCGDSAGGAVLVTANGHYFVVCYVFTQQGRQYHDMTPFSSDQLTALVEYVKRAFTMRQRNRAGFVLHNPRPWEG